MFSTFSMMSPKRCQHFQNIRFFFSHLILIKITIVWYRCFIFSLSYWIIEFFYTEIEQSPSASARSLSASNFSSQFIAEFYVIFDVLSTAKSKILISHHLFGHH